MSKTATANETKENVPTKLDNKPTVAEASKTEEKIENTQEKIVPIIETSNSMINQIINKRLQEIGYEVHDKSLCLFRVKQNNTTGGLEKEYMPICNVVPVTIEQVLYKNGKDEDVAYIVEGILLDTNAKLPSITVSSEEMNRVSYFSNPKWKRMAIFQPVPHVEKYVRYVVDNISRDIMKCTEVYTHTGFTRINNKLVYLYHGGVIGDVKGINVDLSQDRLEQYKFTDKTFNLKEALQTSYSILDVADVKITIPLLATIYLSPLVSLLRENGIFADYIVWLEGKTGSRKSSLTAVAQCHYGEFTRNRFPCSFRDTINSLEKKAFILKDSLVCVDDFNPEAVGNGKTLVAEKLFAMYGDRTGRDRMSANGRTLKSPYTARGLAIVTAECFPDIAQSRLARAIIVDIKPDSIDLNKLRNLQENYEILSFAMKEFILWVIKNETEIISEVKEMYKTLEIQSQTNTFHGRTNEAVNVMNIGFYLFLKFLKENDVISNDELEEKVKLCSTTLNELARRQSVEIENESPVNMFKEAIEQLCETEKVQIIDYNAPCNILANRTLIGYVDNEEEKYYFLPNVLYREIVKFYNEQGVKFPISKPALLKYLENEGYLYRTPKSDRRTIKKKIRNSVLPVMAIYKDKLGLGVDDKDNILEFKKQQEEIKNELDEHFGNL